MDLPGMTPFLDYFYKYTLAFAVECFYQGIIKRGFNVGSVDELKEQARRGGVRLPGSHSVAAAHRSIYTDPEYDMTEFIKPRNIIRVKGKPLLYDATCIAGT